MRNTPAWWNKSETVKHYCLKVSQGVWWDWFWVYPYEHDWKTMKTLEGKSSASPGEAQFKIEKEKR